MVTAFPIRCKLTSLQWPAAPRRLAGAAGWEIVVALILVLLTAACLLLTRSSCPSLVSRKNGSGCSNARRGTDAVFVEDEHPTGEGLPSNIMPQNESVQPGKAAPLGEAASPGESAPPGKAALHGAAASEEPTTARQPNSRKVSPTPQHVVALGSLSKSLSFHTERAAPVHSIGKDENEGVFGVKNPEGYDTVTCKSTLSSCIAPVASQREAEAVAAPALLARMGAGTDSSAAAPVSPLADKQKVSRAAMLEEATPRFGSVRSPSKSEVGYDQWYEQRKEERKQELAQSQWTGAEPLDARLAPKSTKHLHSMSLLLSIACLAPR